MTKYYAILDDEHNLVFPDTIDEWGAFMEDEHKSRVAYDEIRHGDTTIKVSTVFLGLNHNLTPGPPLWFETMVFWPGNEDWDQYQERHENWQTAAYRHGRVLAAVKQSLDYFPPGTEPGLAAQITASLLDDLEQQETDEPFIWPETAHEAQD